MTRLPTDVFSISSFSRLTLLSPKALRLYGDAEGNVLPIDERGIPLEEIDHAEHVERRRNIPDRVGDTLSRMNGPRPGRAIATSLKRSVERP